MTRRNIIIALSVIAVLVAAFIAESGFPQPDNSEPDLHTPVKEERVIPTEREEVSDSVTEKTVQNEEIQNSVETAQDNQEDFIITPEVPVQPEETEKNSSCTLSVNCFSVLENYEKLKESKRQIIPEDGVVFKEREVEFFPDESVFDVLHREMKNNGIHLDFISNPMYNSVYIKGIANLYEFDCGDLSGWFYSVNGVKPTFGCSQYKLKDGDKIEFFYTCNMLE